MGGAIEGALASGPIGAAIEGAPTGAAREPFTTGAIVRDEGAIDGCDRLIMPGSGRSSFPEAAARFGAWVVAGSRKPEE